MALHEAVKNLEAVLKAEDQAGLSEALAKMTETLDRTCRILSPLQKAERAPSPPGGADVDREAILPHLKKLSRYLAESDIEAQSVLEEIQPLVGGTPMEAAFLQVAGHVSAYAFEEALEELKRASLTFDLGV